MAAVRTEQRNEFATSRRLDVTGAATYLGLSVRHVRGLVFERRIPHFKLGGRLVFDSADLDAYLEACRRPAVR